MLISHQAKFLLIHIQRTGGGSVARVLKPLIDHPKGGRIACASALLPIKRNPHRLFFGAHIKAREVRLRWPRQAWDEYFKFAFVRNPYSWIVSLYTRIGSSPTHGHSKRVAAMTFPEFVDWEIARNRRHQHRFVCDRAGNLILDFVGRLEHLEADVATICQRIGISPHGALPRLGGRDRAPWRSFYDEATRRKVAAHWARDIEYFGYDFEGPIAGIPSVTELFASK